jgi:hypothetical protein
MIILPRQARDRHRESTQKQTVFSGDRGEEQEGWTGNRGNGAFNGRRADQVRTRVFLRRFVLNVILLPRQARDKHRENSKQRRVFLQVHGENVVDGVPRRYLVGSKGYEAMD